jgi:hypothetical protein
MHRRHVGEGGDFFNRSGGSSFSDSLSLSFFFFGLCRYEIGTYTPVSSYHDNKKN